MRDPQLEDWIRWLPASRSLRTVALLEELQGAPAWGADDVLRTAVPVLGDAFFSDLCESAIAGQAVRSTAFLPGGSDRIEPPAVLPVALANPDHLGVSLLSSVAKATSDPGIAVGADSLLRAAVLAELDLRIQILYRLHLLARRIDLHDDATADDHAGILERLQAETRDAVETFLAAADLREIASLFGEGAGSERAARVRLSQAAFPLQGVNLRFTHHCNVECRHCYNRSGPDSADPHLDFERMRTMVAEMPELGMEHIILTGGEPFLYLDTLLEVIRAARLHGIRGVCIFTNAFWAGTPDRTRAVLGKLTEAGFMGDSATSHDFLKTSAGTYHQEAGISVDCVRNLALVYYEKYGRPLIVDCESEESLRPCVTAELQRRFTASGLDEGSFTLVSRPIAAAGRALDLPGAVRKYGPETFGACDSIDQIAFDPDGRCRPCCGVNEENEGLVVGNFMAPLRSAVREIQNRPILQYLKRRPVATLLDALGKPRREGYSSICEICQHALGDADPEGVRAAFERRLVPWTRFYPHWLADG